MSRRTEKSQAAFESANKVLVGGVNSPVRAYCAVGGTPPVIAKAAGASITDLDDNTYLDYVGSFGPAILGHAPEQVVTAINKVARRGTSFGALCELETGLAGAIVAAMGSIEKVRFVTSGTEAVMTACRLARATTGRDKIIKCIGGYHGHSDGMLVSAGSGATTLGQPSSPGVPAGAAADTILVGYNDLPAAAGAFVDSPDKIAAILIEPVAGNMGVILPQEGYLQGLRDLCDANGALLIFDEVITGFRLAYGGAQEVFGVQADLTTLGKIIGGGLPIGAVGGRSELMNNLAPAGKVYQAGTLAGNPIAMAAGIAVLNVLRGDGVYDRLQEVADTLAAGLAEAAERAKLTGHVTLNHISSMLCCFFSAGPVSNYDQATASNTEAFAAYFHKMLDEGIYLPPSQFETMFVSTAHTTCDIERTIDAAAKGFLTAAKFMQNS